MTQPRKKLIEVALPLEAINAASAREKSIRHGHPSTLHLWWARRPLAACRAVLFAQLVDDPSSVPEEFPTEVEQETERQRLFRIIERLVVWENSNEVSVINEARREIARSVARILGEEPPEEEDAINRFLATKVPPVVDPFCGGGSIPLEAQRLGLRVHGSDLNPVAVLITKALIEIPPRFAGQPSVHPEARAQFVGVGGSGSAGLAKDVRLYGKWMRNEAERRIGFFYPKARVTKGMARKRKDLVQYEGKDLTVVAWLWARTVSSPNPAAGGAHVPLVSSFVISSKKGREVIVVPVTERDGYRFEVKIKGVTSEEIKKARFGTKAGRGASFTCLLSNTPIPSEHIRAESMAGRMSERLIAVVAEGERSRVYLNASQKMEELARSAVPAWRPEQEMNRETPNLVSGRGYGFFSWGDLFTDRQLVALSVFSDLVGEIRTRILADAIAAGMDPSAGQLSNGGSGAEAYADAVATYLGLGLARFSDRSSSLSGWDSGYEKIRNTFGRQAIPMVWDYAESNPFSNSTGNWNACVDWISKVVAGLPVSVVSTASVVQRDAASRATAVSGTIVVSTDPPYYDNICYADLSDYFYLWLRKCMGSLHGNLLKTLLTPKAEELVAAPYRFGGNKNEARRFFENGLGQATKIIRTSHAAEYPMTMFYAYKQAETSSSNGIESTASTGWETLLSGLIKSGFTITGTFPVRSELGNRLLAKGTNALTSSIVLACRARSADAPIASKRDFMTALGRELPEAIRQLQRENIAPVDLVQSAIGPGMAVYSRYSEVVEADGSLMTVRQALIDINRVLDKTLAETEVDLDKNTRFCTAWFEQHGFAERPYGEAEVLCLAKNTSFLGLEQAGVIMSNSGKARLRHWDELDLSWESVTDCRLTDWESVMQMVRAMMAQHGGGVKGAARLAQRIGPSRAETARSLAYRLYTISERKGWSEDALAFNVLVTSWQPIQAEIASIVLDGEDQMLGPVAT